MIPSKIIPGRNIHLSELFSSRTKIFGIVTAYCFSAYNSKVMPSGFGAEASIREILELHSLPFCGTSLSELSHYACNPHLLTRTLIDRYYALLRNSLCRAGDLSWLPLYEFFRSFLSPGQFYADIVPLTSAFQCHPRLLIDSHLKSSYHYTYYFAPGRKELTRVLRCDFPLDEYTLGPSVQISFAHSHRLVDIVKAISHDLLPLNDIHLWWSSDGYGYELCKYLESSSPGFRFIIRDFYDCRATLAKLSASYSHDLHQYYLDESHCNFLMNQDRTVSISDAIDSLCPPLSLVHIRTASFKRDTFNKHANVRNSNVHTCLPALRNICEVLQSKPVVYTSSAEDTPKIPLSYVVPVASSAITSNQFRLLRRADAFMGSASGLTHLTHLHNTPSLYVNICDLMPQNQIPGIHLICMKSIRFDFAAIKPPFAPASVLLYAIFGGLADSLLFNQHISFIDLCQRDILNASNEFLGFLDSPNTNQPVSIQDMLGRWGLSDNVILPTRYLSANTVQMLDLLMCHYIDLLSSSPDQ
jgi:hypothetical protein